MNNPLTITENVIARLPQPDDKPVPDFFGRRFLTAHDLFEIGIVNNAMTLRRLISEKRFPPPLKLGRQIRLWDVLEIQDLIDRLKSERDQTEATSGLLSDPPAVHSNAPADRAGHPPPSET
jgi:hypothetical protein